MQFQVFLDQNRQYRWRLVANNGRIVATSGESYHNKKDCTDAMVLVMNTNTSTPWYDMTQQ